MGAFIHPACFLNACHARLYTKRWEYSREPGRCVICSYEIYSFLFSPENALNLPLELRAYGSQCCVPSNCIGNRVSSGVCSTVSSQRQSRTEAVLAGRIPWRRAWQPSPVFLPGKSHGQRSLVGYSVWCWKEPAMRLTLSRFFRWIKGVTWEQLSRWAQIYQDWYWREALSMGRHDIDLCVWAVGMVTNTALPVPEAHACSPVSSSEYCQWGG